MKPFNLNRKLSRGIVYSAAFVLPLIIMIIIYAFMKIYPFGDRTVLVMDLNGQYADFFMWYRRVLLGEDSLFYSFTKEMGGNTFGLFAYYLTSPFFLLTLLFPKGAMPEGMALITVLKIASCGLTFAIFARHVLKRCDLGVVMFSCAYALMTYSMHYAMCIMWLDGAIWLPIVLMGIDNVIKDKSAWLFLIAYTAALISNYYTAYMISLFSVIYFIYSYIASNNDKGVKDFLKKCCFCFWQG